jgi:SAM-dependent methyltransferase
MFALPFGDDHFDVATSFNGIWKGCEDALREARRVVRPGGLAGFSFWGSPRRLGLLPYFATLLELSPARHADATLNQGDTGRPGVAEQMLADAGLEFVDRGTAQVVNEWPDLDLAARGARVGRAVLARRAGGRVRPVHRGGPRGNPAVLRRWSRRPHRLRVRLDHGTGPRRLTPIAGAGWGRLPDSGPGPVRTVPRRRASCLREPPPRRPRPRADTTGRGR